MQQELIMLKRKQIRHNRIASVGYVVILFTQLLRSGRMWHKVNFFLSGV